MTRFNNKYPYTDFHELNADWLLETVKDAAADAKEAAETVETYNDRLTTVEGDLAPIKAAMPGLASDVSDLQHDVGIIDSLITNTINPGLETLQTEVETTSTGLLDRMTAAEGSISTLENEVETPTTGLLDRVTALENQPSVGGVTEYLKFSSDATPFDYDARITYTYLDDLIATTASADKTVNIVLVEDDELGTTWYYTLTEGEYQISAGTPRGQFVFICRKPVFDANNVVVGFNVCSVVVNKNAATPAYSEVYEAVLPEVSVADAGSFLAVDANGDWTLDAPSGGENRTPISYGTLTGGVASVVNHSYYTDKDFVVDISFKTTISRTETNLVYIDAGTFLPSDLTTTFLPLTISECNDSTGVPIVGSAASLIYDSGSNWVINVTCPSAGILRIRETFTYRN